MKYFWLIALVLLNLTSCNLFDEDSNENSDILGSWAVDDVDGIDSIRRVFTFNSNGTFLIENFDMENMPKSIFYTDGNYSIEENLLEFDYKREFHFSEDEWSEKELTTESNELVSAEDYTAYNSLITYKVTENKLSITYGQKVISYLKIESHPVRSN